MGAVGSTTLMRRSAANLLSLCASTAQSRPGSRATSTSGRITKTPSPYPPLTPRMVLIPTAARASSCRRCVRFADTRYPHLPCSSSTLCNVCARAVFKYLFTTTLAQCAQVQTQLLNIIPPLHWYNARKAKTRTSSWQHGMCNEKQPTHLLMSEALTSQASASESRYNPHAHKAAHNPPFSHSLLLPSHSQ